MAFNFGAVGGYNVPDSADWDVSSWTMEAWVYPTGTADQYDYIMSQESGANYNVLFVVSGLFRIASSLDAVNTDDGQGAVPRDAWIHLAGVRNAGSTLKWFRNGVETKSLAITNSSTSAIAAALGLAQRSDNTLFWRGYCDEFRFWNVARTGKQILRDMYRRIPGQTGLMGLWRTYQSGVPTTLYDQTQRGNNGTKQGTVTAVNGLPNIYNLSG